MIIHTAVAINHKACSFLFLFCFGLVWFPFPSAIWDYIPTMNKQPGNWKSFHSYDITKSVGSALSLVGQVDGRVSEMGGWKLIWCYACEPDRNDSWLDRMLHRTGGQVGVSVV
ncbi:hypothetical protein F5B19DRAFT_85932 [Rostrohypoxylon terebratum]|nr:hypothetical protein F5B19DRAFT_85932 [Rostrohypoxylon terebratum]